MVITSANTTLEYFDGFDDYDISQILRYWNTNIVSAMLTTISSSAGRNSTFSLRFSGTANSGNLGYVTLTLTAQATRTIGFAIKILALGLNSYSYKIFSLYDSSTEQLYIKVNASGTISICRGGGTVLGTSSLSLSANTYYYIELTSVINNSTGSYTLKVNGATWSTGSSLNTRASSNNSADIICLGLTGLESGAGNITPQLDYDDFYSRSDSTFCGDSRVESKLPTGNGNANQWTPSTGSNYQNVDDNPSNDDTDYNSSDTAAELDQYTYPALATTVGTIHAVMTVPILKVNTAGTATAASSYRSGSSNYPGGTQSISATTYAPYPDIQGEDPDISAPWTVSGINAAQFGIERLS